LAGGTSTIGRGIGVIGDVDENPWLESPSRGCSPAPIPAGWDTKKVEVILGDTPNPFRPLIRKIWTPDARKVGNATQLNFERVGVQRENEVRRLGRRRGRAGRWKTDC